MCVYFNQSLKQNEIIISDFKPEENLSTKSNISTLQSRKHAIALVTFLSRENEFQISSRFHC